MNRQRTVLRYASLALADLCNYHDTAAYPPEDDPRETLQHILDICLLRMDPEHKKKVLCVAIGLGLEGLVKTSGSVHIEVPKK